jgi:membrane-associated protein
VDKRFNADTYSVIDFILHFDKHLIEFVELYGTWVYGFLFAIVFAETGLVVAPFLPGDSLLFATGALAGAGMLNIWLCAGLLLVAAIAGDAVNYAVGRYVGPRAFSATDTTGWTHRLLNRAHLERAHEFFERYGGKAVVLGRFVPIVRTFVPFVAGAGAMTYGTFAFYNVTGAILWVGVCMGAGWLFGQTPIVRDNFSLITIGIVLVSVLPMIVEILRVWLKNRKQ